MELCANLYVRAKNIGQAERLVFYLDPQTRPDFPEEVPEEECDWVEAFESVDSPTSIDKNGMSILARFQFFDNLEDMERTGETVAMLEPEIVLMFIEDDEEHHAYYVFRSGKFEFLYNTIPMDDPEIEEQHNKQLPKALREQLDELEGTREAFEALADHLCHETR